LLLDGGNQVGEEVVVHDLGQESNLSRNNENELFSQPAAESTETKMELDDTRRKVQNRE
jgi:hypothetical protein